MKKMEFCFEGLILIPKLTHHLLAKLNLLYAISERVLSNPSLVTRIITMLSAHPRQRMLRSVSKSKSSSTIRLTVEVKGHRLMGNPLSS